MFVMSFILLNICLKVIYVNESHYISEGRILLNNGISVRWGWVQCVYFRVCVCVYEWVCVNMCVYISAFLIFIIREDWPHYRQGHWLIDPAYCQWEWTESTAAGHLSWRKWLSPSHRGTQIKHWCTISNDNNDIIKPCISSEREEHFGELKRKKSFRI